MKIANYCFVTVHLENFAYDLIVMEYLLDIQIIIESHIGNQSKLFESIINSVKYNSSDNFVQIYNIHNEAPWQDILPMYGQYARTYEQQWKFWVVIGILDSNGNYEQWWELWVVMGIMGSDGNYG